MPSIKGALHRGRANLRRQVAAGDAPPAPALPREQVALLGRYVALFNARDFDALRAMLAEDDQLELVGMTEKSGAADVGGYFNNYARLEGMRLELGAVDGRPAILAREQPAGPPVCFLFVRFRDERIRFIRDYRYARYVFDEAQWTRATEARPAFLGRSRVSSRQPPSTPSREQDVEMYEPAEQATGARQRAAGYTKKRSNASSTALGSSSAR